MNHLKLVAEAEMSRLLGLSTRTDLTGLNGALEMCQEEKKTFGTFLKIFIITDIL